MSKNDPIQLRKSLDLENLRIIIKNIDALKDKIFITGFHGLGGIGHLTVRYIVETAIKQGQGRKIGHIVSNLMPPFVEVLSEGDLGIPYEIIEVGDAVLLLIRFQPTLEEQTILADELTKLSAQVGIKAFMLMGGIDSSAFGNRDEILPLVYVANEKFKEEIIPSMKNWNLKTAPKGIFVTGGVALFLTYATHRNIPAAALFAPTEKGIINKEEALRLAKKVIELLDLSISLDELEKEIQIAQIALRKLQEKLLTETRKKEEAPEDVSQLFT